MELLAPAGTMENFIAALESGADAIYLGGKGFNARAHAANFGIEELAEAIRCLLYTSPSPRDVEESRMPSSA